MVSVEQLFDAVGDFFEHRGLGDDDVAGERRLRRRDGPDVDVVHVEHPVEGLDTVMYVVHIVAFGHGVGAHAQALTQEVPCGDEDDNGYDDADDGVDDVPAGVVDDHAGDDDSDGDQRVGQHVEEGTTGVDIVLLLAAEYPGGDAVDDDAHGGRPDDKRAVDFGGVEEFLHALHHDGTHGDEEDDGVEERDEH